MQNDMLPPVQIIADLAGCTRKERMVDSGRACEGLLRAIAAPGMTPGAHVAHDFGETPATAPYTLCAILEQEHHVALHMWPEQGIVNLDCSFYADPDRAKVLATDLVDRIGSFYGAAWDIRPTERVSEVMAPEGRPYPVQIITALQACERMDRFGDVERQRAEIIGLVRAGGMTPVASVGKDFRVRGRAPCYTLCVIVSESHVILWTDPEERSVTVDVFFCNYTADNRQRAADVVARLADFFGGTPGPRRHVPRLP